VKLIAREKKNIIKGGLLIKVQWGSHEVREVVRLQGKFRITKKNQLKIRRGFRENIEQRTYVLYSNSNL